MFQQDDAPSVHRPLINGQVLRVGYHINNAAHTNDWRGVVPVQASLKEEVGGDNEEGVHT